MTSGSSRIERVDIPINQAVECHRCRSGANHRYQKSGQFAPRELRRLRRGSNPGHHCREQRKRQREQRMAEPNHFEKVFELLEHSGL